MKLKRVCAYCRVSTKSDEQKSSIENQSEYFRKLFDEHKGEWELVGTYEDWGKSGVKLSRPGFNEMLEDCGLNKKFEIVKESKIDLILVKNTSRFARTTEVSTVIKKLRENKVYVHFLDIDKSTENVSDMIIIDILNAISAAESRDKSDKVKFGINMSAERNEIKTHPKILGYDYIPRPEKRLVKNKDAVIVQTIFELYAKGYGYYRVSKELTKLGYLTSVGKPFVKSQIERILSNEKYAGYNNPLKFDSGNVFDGYKSQKV